MKKTITKIPKSSVKIEAEIDAKEFEKYRPEAVKHLAEGREIPGFRKGTAPEQVLIRHYGEMALLEEMADLALRKIYPEIIIEEKIDAIGAPKISITKIGKGSPLAFTIETAVVPEFKLPDWKKIAAGIKKEEAEEIKDEDIEKVFSDLKKHHEDSGKKAENDDDLAKSFGDFKDAAALKAKLRENMGLEKKYAAEEKRRIAILEALAKETNVEIPEVLVENELSRMRARFEGDLERHKMNFSEYLKRINKTEEDINNEWRGSAEKNVRIELVLGKIASEEKITPEEKLIENETRHLLEHNKDVPEERAREYVTSLLIKDLTIRKLEEIK